MKHTNPFIVLTWYDTDGMKQRTHLTFKGTIDHRKLRKILFDFIERNFKQRVSNQYLDDIINANMEAAKVIQSKYKSLTKQAIEAWIKRIEDPNDEAVDSDGSQGVQEEATPEEPLLPFMSEGSKE